MSYYPFGMTMVGRKYTNGGSYRYGFNGKENDIDAGEGIQDYGMRIYNKRLGRFFSVDPLTKKYAFLTPYAFAENDVISSVDIDGLEKYRITIRAFIPFEKVVLDQVNIGSGTIWGTNYAVHGEAREACYDLSKLGYSENIEGNEGYRVQFEFEIDLDAPKGKELNDLGTKAGTTIVYAQTEDNNIIYQLFPMLFPPPFEWGEIWRGKAENGKDNKYKLDIPENLSNMNTKNFVVSLKVSALFPYHDFPFNVFPAIDANILIRFQRDENNKVAMSGTATLDGFPAFEGFINRIDKPNYKPYLFLNTSPKSGSEGIKLLPVIGDNVNVISEVELKGHNYE